MKWNLAWTKFLTISLCGIFTACSTSTTSAGEIECPGCGVKLKSSSSHAGLSSAAGNSSSSDGLLISWVQTDSFAIAQTEIMQADYALLMDTLPKQMAKAEGDSFPVANVSWYDAIRFANALSKHLGLDTAYSYSAVAAGGTLLNLQMNDTASAVRLPFRDEWEAAARGGSSDTYYWGTAPAENYAVYGKATDSYQKVAGKIPNGWKLYDVAGNLAEWTADTALCGGSWTSIVKEIAPDECEKKQPDFASNISGFRVLRTDLKAKENSADSTAAQ